MDFILPLVSFAFVTSITPGPNNIMLTSSGLRFGFRRSIPHILGINAGMAVLLLLSGMGVGELVMQFPVLNDILRLIGSGYLVYLAWQLRTNHVTEQKGLAGEPMRFAHALLFQFANPKALMMAVTSAAILMPEFSNLWLSVAVFAAVFCLINLPCISFWALAGAVIKRYLTNPVWQRVFSGVVIVLTLYAALAIWL